jgi:hypothetical protein
MKSKIFLFWPVSVLILLFGSYSPVLSQENIKLGFLELHPFVKASEVFTDNILQTKEEKKHASISTITPGLEIRIPISWHLLRLEYHNDLHYISNLNQNSTNHSIATNLDLNFPGGLLLKVSERYLQSIYPASTEETGLVERSQNDILFELGYKFTDRWVVKGGYYNTIHDYQESKAEDRIVHKGGGTLMLRILSRTSLLAEIQGVTTGYRRIPDRNFTSLNGLLGAQGQLTPKTNILLKLGFQQHNYEQARLSDFTRFTASFSLLNKLSPYTSFSATASREAVESFWLSNAYYTSSKASLSINRKFLRKFSAALNFSYWLNNYHQEELHYGTSRLRRDTILGCGLDLLYEIQQWLELSAGYSYRSRDSNFPFDYSENRVSLTAAVVF